jgi:hypothetical protein
MDKREMAEFCAKISSGMNKSKTFEEWVEVYMAMSESSLADEYRSYGC